MGNPGINEEDLFFTPSSSIRMESLKSTGSVIEMSDMLLFADQLSLDDAGQRRKPHRAAGDTLRQANRGGTAGAVAAHFGHRAVIIVELPAEIFCLAVFDQDQPVGTNGKSAPADQLGKLRLIGLGDKPGAMVDNDKIVACTAHFGDRYGKIQFHNRSKAIIYLTVASFDAFDSLAGSAVSIAVTK